MCERYYIAEEDAAADLREIIEEVNRRNNGEEKKVKTAGEIIQYAIRQAGEKTLYMAGLYRIEGNKAVFTILTREPAESIAFIHDRMPVILPNEMKEDWLNLQYDAADIKRSVMKNRPRIHEGHGAGII